MASIMSPSTRILPCMKAEVGLKAAVDEFPEVVRRHGDGAFGGIVLVHGDRVLAACAVDKEAAGFSQIEFEGSAEGRLPAYALRHGRRLLPASPSLAPWVASSR